MTSDDKIEPEHEQQMNALAKVIDDLFNGDQRPKPYGFLFAVFPMGEGGRFNYISNCDRRDVVTLMKEMIARFEGQPEMKGHG